MGLVTVMISQLVTRLNKHRRISQILCKLRFLKPRKPTTVEPQYNVRKPRDWQNIFLSYYNSGTTRFRFVVDLFSYILLFRSEAKKIVHYTKDLTSPHRVHISTRKFFYVSHLTRILTWQD